MRGFLLTLLVLRIVVTPAFPKSFFHPKLRSDEGRTIRIKNVLLLPPKVTDISVGWKGMEPMGEEGARIAEAMTEWVALALRHREFRLTPSPYSPDLADREPHRLYAVARLQKNYDDLFPYLLSRPQDIREARYTLGHEIGLSMLESEADTVVFMRAAVLKRRLGSDYRMWCSISLVHVRTGDIVFYNEVESGGKFEPARSALQQRLAFELRYLSAGGIDY